MQMYAMYAIYIGRKRIGNQLSDCVVCFSVTNDGQYSIAINRSQSAVKQQQ